MFLKFVYRKVSKVFYVGVRNKDYMIHYGIQQDHLVFAPTVVDNHRFNSSRKRFIELAIQGRRNLRIKDSDIVFIYTGKFYQLKRLDILIKAFKSIISENIKLLLVGNGEDEFKLKELARNDERIIFESFKNQSDMPWVYRMGDVFVMPSERETWGLSVNEAMACGLPAIVSEVCGCAPELIINNETGYVFAKNNIHDLKMKILNFPDRSACTRMGESALLHISNFNIDSLVLAYENELKAGVV
jgi:glycosyltransferase involved in cell wall biosynthesis